MSHLIIISLMRTTIWNFADSLAARASENGRHETAKCYRCAVRRLLDFTGNPRLTFADVDSPLLLRFEQWLLDTGRHRNTISLYMRLLRAITNIAVRRRLAAPDDERFAHIFTGHVPTRKCAVTLDVIERIRTARLDDGRARLAFARDLFMLSFYLRGIPFVDLAHLRKTDVCDGVLYYRRRKTGRQLCVFIEPCAWTIVRRWALPDSPFLLPILKTHGCAPTHSCYETALRLYNLKLAELGRVLGLEQRLTSYVPRHSWATIAYARGVSVAYISEALSHTSERTTRFYLRSFHPDTLADVNRYLIGLLDDDGVADAAAAPFGHRSADCPGAF